MPKFEQSETRRYRPSILTNYTLIANDSFRIVLNRFSSFVTRCPTYPSHLWYTGISLAPVSYENSNLSAISTLLPTTGGRQVIPWALILELHLFSGWISTISSRSGQLFSILQFTRIAFHTHHRLTWTLIFRQLHLCLNLIDIYSRNGLHTMHRRIISALPNLLYSHAYSTLHILQVSSSINVKVTLRCLSSSRRH